MKCNIKILWADVVARDVLFDALVPHTQKFSVTTEVDDGIYWIGSDNAVQEKISVNVYAAALAYNPANIADRIVELYRTRSVRYVALNLDDITQDQFHAWHSALQARVASPVYVFDPSIGGPLLDQLIQDMQNGYSRATERALPSVAELGGNDEEGHW